MENEFDLVEGMKIYRGMISGSLSEMIWHEKAFAQWGNKETRELVARLYKEAIH